MKASLTPSTLLGKEMSLLWYGPTINSRMNFWNDFTFDFSFNQSTVVGNNPAGAIFYGLSGSYSYYYGLSYFLYEGKKISIEIRLSKGVSQGIQLSPIDSITKLVNQIIDLSQSQLTTYSTNYLLETKQNSLNSTLQSYFEITDFLGSSVSLVYSDEEYFSSKSVKNSNDRKWSINPVFNLYKGLNHVVVYTAGTTRSFQSEKIDDPWVFTHMLASVRNSEFVVGLIYQHSKSSSNESSFTGLSSNYSW